MGADIGESGLDFRDAVRIACAFRLREQPRALAVGFEDGFDQIFRAVRRFLREPADAPARRYLHAAALGRDLAANRAEQRCLAGSVTPNESDARASRNACRRTVKQTFAGDIQHQIVNDQHVGFLPCKCGDATPHDCCGKEEIVRSWVLAKRTWMLRQEVTMCVPGCQAAVRSALSRRSLLKGAGAVTAGLSASSVAKGQVPGRRFNSVIDLTHTMSPDFPTFFGVPGIEMQKQFDLRKDGFNLYWWRIIEHAGTHFDAPIHFSENGATADQFGADDLVVPLVVIDVSTKAAHNPDYLLSREDLAAWESRHGRVPEQCCVAMHSGWARHVADAAKYTGKDAAGAFHFPGVSSQAAEWLMQERRVIGLAVDTLSLDHGPSKDFKTHLLWLPSGRWGLENVANLDRVPAWGATLVVGLAKVKDATGGPARLMALV